MLQSFLGSRGLLAHETIKSAACIAYESAAAHKRHVMLFWKNSFSCSFLCLSCISFRQYIQINVVKSGGFGEKHIKETDLLRRFLKKQGIQSFCTLRINNHVFYDCSCLEMVCFLDWSQINMYICV